MKRSTLCKRSNDEREHRRPKVEKRRAKNGGERGIRTLDTREGITIFETVAFGHSAISPLAVAPNITPVCRKIKKNHTQS